MNSNAAELEVPPASFGARLLEERLRLRLQLHEMAHLAGVTDYMQRRFENGTSVIPIDYLYLLELRTDADTGYIITGTRTS